MTMSPLAAASPWSVARCCPTLAPSVIDRTRGSSPTSRATPPWTPSGEPSLTRITSNGTRASKKPVSSFTVLARQASDRYTGITTDSCGSELMQDPGGAHDDLFLIVVAQV